MNRIDILTDSTLKISSESVLISSSMNIYPSLPLKIQSNSTIETLILFFSPSSASSSYSISLNLLYLKMHVRLSVFFLLFDSTFILAFFRSYSILYLSISTFSILCLYFLSVSSLPTLCLKSSLEIREVLAENICSVLSPCRQYLSTVIFIVLF